EVSSIKLTKSYTCHSQNERALRMRMTRVPCRRSPVDGGMGQLYCLIPRLARGVGSRQVSGCQLLCSPVNVPSMANLQDDDDQSSTLHTVQDTIDADANPEHVGVAAQFSRTLRIRILP